MFKNIIIFLILLLFTSCSYINPEVNMKNFKKVSEDKASLVKKGRFYKYCSRCENSLLDNYKTNHIAIKGNKISQYCSLHCLAGHLKNSKNITNPRVIDTNNLKFINVEDAFYVVDSDMPATRSKVSKYAFSSLGEAKKFEEKYDGDIVNFYKALDIAREDFKKEETILEKLYSLIPFI